MHWNGLGCRVTGMGGMQGDSECHCELKGDCVVKWVKG